MISTSSVCERAGVAAPDLLAPSSFLASEFTTAGAERSAGSPLRIRVIISSAIVFRTFLASSSLLKSDRAADGVDDGDKSSTTVFSHPSSAHIIKENERLTSLA